MVSDDLTVFFNASLAAEASRLGVALCEGWLAEEATLYLQGFKV
jgi:hypothetical protein